MLSHLPRCPHLNFLGHTHFLCQRAGVRSYFRSINWKNLWTSPGLVNFGLMLRIFILSKNFRTLSFLDTGCSLKIVFFPQNVVLFLKSANSTAALVFYLPGVCMHTDTEGKQSPEYLKKLDKTQYLMNTLYYTDVQKLVIDIVQSCLSVSLWLCCVF